MIGGGGSGRRIDWLSIGALRLSVRLLRLHVHRLSSVGLCTGILVDDVFLDDWGWCGSRDNDSRAGDRVDRSRVRSRSSRAAEAADHNDGHSNDNCTKLEKKKCEPKTQNDSKINKFVGAKNEHF